MSTPGVFVTFFEILGQLFNRKEEYEIIDDNSSDDKIFEELLLKKTITEVNEILSKHDFYYNNRLIKEICDGECSEFCNHYVFVDIGNDGKITGIFRDDIYELLPGYI
jgi:hypothetical protein